MRVLVVSPHAAFQPPRGGTGIRIANTVRQLVALGHTVDFFGVHAGGGQPVTGLEPLCRRHLVVTLPSKTRGSALLQSLADRRPFPANRFQDAAVKAQAAAWMGREAYDAVWVNFLFMLEYLTTVPLDRVPVVLDQHEDEERLWEGLCTGVSLRRLFAAWNLRKLRPYQARLLRRVQALLCVSPEEAAHMRSRVPAGTPVWMVPNGVDVEAFRPVPELTREPALLFLGSLNVLRNADALLWFIRTMWPAVRRAVPAARLMVIGGDPTRGIRRAARAPGIDLVGPVDDVRPYYARCRAFVAPFRFGVGTRLKVLEAMAMGVPIVSTPMGTVGLDVEDGRHVLLAPTPEAFARQVVRVLQEPPLADGLRTEARRLVEDRYGWTRIIAEASARMGTLVQAAATEPASAPWAAAGAGR